MYRVLNRDPVAKPLTTFEWEIFYRCLQEHLDAEVVPRVETALLTGGMGNREG